MTRLRSTSTGTESGGRARSISRDRANVDPSGALFLVVYNKHAVLDTPRTTAAPNPLVTYIRELHESEAWVL